MNEHLYRSRDDRMLAGVAGGLAEIWDADPSFVRIGWALLAILTGGVAIVVYIVMAIVVPEEPFGAWASDPSAPPVGPDPVVPGWVPPGPRPIVPDPAAAAAPGAPVWTQAGDARAARRAARAARRASRRDTRDGSAGLIFGGLLVVIGAAFLVREFVPSFDFDVFWPLVLVGLGVVLLAGSLTRGSRTGQERPS